MSRLLIKNDDGTYTECEILPEGECLHTAGQITNSIRVVTIHGLIWANPEKILFEDELEVQISDFFDVKN